MKNRRLLAAELLESAAMVVAIPDWWAQGATAYTSKSSDGSCDGLSATEPTNPDAICFCAIGAIQAASYEIPKENRVAVQMTARNAAVFMVPDMGLTLWNDKSYRTPQQVAELLWNAAQGLRNGC